MVESGKGGDKHMQEKHMQEKQKKLQPFTDIQGDFGGCGCGVKIHANLHSMQTCSIVQDRN